MFFICRYICSYICYPKTPITDSSLTHKKLLILISNNAFIFTFKLINFTLRLILKFMAKYNLSNIELNQSVEFELSDLNSIRATASNYSKKNNKKFKVEKIPTGAKVTRLT